jgi:hypothetical protein
MIAIGLPFIVGANFDVTNIGRPRGRNETVVNVIGSIRFPLEVICRLGFLSVRLTEKVMVRTFQP